MTVILCSQQSASLRFEYGICIRSHPLLVQMWPPGVRKAGLRQAACLEQTLGNHSPNSILTCST